MFPEGCRGPQGAAVRSRALDLSREARLLDRDGHEAAAPDEAQERPGGWTAGAVSQASKSQTSFRIGC